MPKGYVRRDGEEYVSGDQLEPTPSAKVSPLNGSAFILWETMDCVLENKPQCTLQQTWCLSPKRRKSREKRKVQGSSVNLSSRQVL